MTKEIGCSIVQDLLPNYIEKLTSEETNQVIRAHLDTCIECRKIHEAMISDVVIIDKASEPKLKFLKKVRKTKLLAAVISIVLALIVSYAVYAMEFEYSLDKADLSNAVKEFTGHSDDSVDAYVLETKVIDGVLFASFKDRNNETVNGMAKFIKGVNNRYRIVEMVVESSEYSSVVQFYPFESGEEKLVVVSGYNLSDEIKYYGLDYSAYKRPGYNSDHRVRIPVKFETDNLQFLEIHKAEELEERALKTQDSAVYNIHMTGRSFYDESGEEITEKFRIPESDIQNISYGGGKAELFMVYVFIALIAGFGAIMTRYFLTD